MFDAVQALPAGPGESDEDVFPVRLRLRLRDNFGFVLQQLRARDPAFRPLAKGPWSVFIAIAAHFQMNAESWPGQEAIASFSGCSTRAVRYHLAELESDGFLTLRRERRASGGDRIFYRPGPLMLRGLAAFDTDYPKDRPKVLKPARPVAPPTPSASVACTQTHHPEKVAGTPAETVAMEPRDQNTKKPSSSCESRPAMAAAARLDEEEQPVVSKEDREIARWALAERMKRKHPKRPPPRWYDRADIEMVARCTATIDGERTAKEQAQRAAITGAFCASKDGPPTARFIWEKLEHFLEHIERGQRKLRNEALDSQKLREREEDERARRVWRDGINAAAEHTRRNPPTREELAKTRAEFEEIAAEAAPPFRKVLMGFVEQYRALEAKARE
jgi:hypothetical protein